MCNHLYTSEITLLQSIQILVILNYNHAVTEIKAHIPYQNKFIVHNYHDYVYNYNNN